jgi:glycosyltransferase involved in cell wall biosynthesis
MKVLIVHSFYSIDGGENKRVLEDVEMFKSRGHEVELYSKNNVTNYFQDIFELLISPFNPFVYFQLKRLIKRFKPDVVHVHNTWYKLGPSAYFAIKISNAKLFQSLHNLRFFCANAFMLRNGNECTKCLDNKIFSIKYSCYKNRVLSAMSSLHYLIIGKISIFTQSNFYFFSPNYFFDRLIKDLYGLEDANIVKFPNYVKDFQLIPEEKLNLPTEYLLIVGRNSNEKGLDKFLELWKSLDTDLKLVIASPDNLSIGSKNIFYLNNTSDEQLAYVYKNSKGVIIPSNWVEGFPRVIIETSSVNKPIIMSDKIAISQLDSLKEYVLTFNLESKETLEKALEELDNKINDSQFQFRNWYIENFSKDAYLDNIFNEYKAKVK